MDHQSDMQKHIIRNSYRMHKQRLTHIKHNNTSLQFYSSNKSKPQDRKKLMMLQKRKQEIDHQNSILQEKINKIKGKQVKEQTKKQSDQSKNNKHLYNHRYVEQNQQEYNPIEVNSNYGDEVIKCIIPAPYPSNKKFYSQPKKLKALNHTSSGLRQQLQNFNQNKITLQIRKSVLSKGKQQDSILHPQQDIQRVVIYKKTTIIGPMISCLTEISLVGRRMLITAYVMGAQNHTASLLLDEQKTNQLILTYSDNFQALGGKVSVDNHWQIKLSVTWNDDKKLDLLDNSRKAKQPITKEEKYASQQDFIKRNYYIKHKKQQINQSDDQNNLKVSIPKPKTSRQVTEKNPVLRKFGITPSYNSSTDIKEPTTKNTEKSKKSDVRINNFSNKNNQKIKNQAQDKGNIKGAKQSIESKKILKSNQQEKYQENIKQVQEFNDEQNQYEENFIDEVDKKVDSQSLKNISQVQKIQPSYEEDYQEVFEDNQSSIKNVSSVKNQSSIKQSSVNKQSSVKNKSVTQNQSKFAKKQPQEEKINEQYYAQEDFQNKSKPDENNYQEQYQQQYNEQVDDGENYGEDFQGNSPA